jgi:two-component system sensor histidine kinase VanS
VRLDTANSGPYANDSFDAVPLDPGALLRDFAPAATIVLAFLLVFGLLGGWVLVGRMLAPLTGITDATRMAASGSLSHRIRLPGRRDEFRELADAVDAMFARLEAHVVEQRGFAAPLHVERACRTAGTGFQGGQ